MTLTIRDDGQALLILNALPNIGPITTNRLLETAGGGAKAVFALDDEALKATRGVGPVITDTLRRWAEHFNPALEEHLMQASATRFVTREDPEYPSLLREIHDPPIGLYQRGRGVGAERCVAIVGSRNMTRYGESVAGVLGFELARRGFCVVSGLARGIDTAAHLGALKAEGHTAAVLGCGVDLVYPAENRGLFRRIQEVGTLLSEFPLGRRADRQSFAMRNRVVSGMASAVVVVETDIDGGSMITARFAGEQGRPLFAVPGRIDQPSSRGCHQLLRDGATLYSRIEDLLEELDYLEGMAPTLLAVTPKPAGPGGEAGKVLACFGKKEALTTEDVSLRLEMAVADVSGLLLTLELGGFLQRNLDGTYEASR